MSVGLGAYPSLLAVSNAGDRVTGHMDMQIQMDPPWSEKKNYTSSWEDAVPTCLYPISAAHIKAKVIKLQCCKWPSLAKANVRKHH